MTVALTESRMALRWAPKSPHLVQDISGFTGGLPLVPHPHGQAAPDLQSLAQLAALLGALALGAVHVERQAHHNELCLLLLGNAADLGGHLGPGLRVIWGVMGVVRNSVGSQTASPVRLAP